LREIFDRHPQSVAFIIGDKKKDRKGFIHKVWATRNYLTHYDEGLKEQTLRGQELYRVTRQLRSLIEICLLHEIGMKDGDIKKRLTRKPPRE
jgi:hypothetical protein